MSRDAVEWLEMMAKHSGLKDCVPMFTAIAVEVKALRAQVAAFEQRQQRTGFEAGLEAAAAHIEAIGDYASDRRAADIRALDMN